MPLSVCEEASYPPTGKQPDRQEGSPGGHQQRFWPMYHVYLHIRPFTHAREGRIRGPLERSTLSSRARVSSLHFLVQTVQRVYKAPPTWANACTTCRYPCGTRRHGILDNTTLTRGEGCTTSCGTRPDTPGRVRGVQLAGWKNSPDNLDRRSRGGLRRPRVIDRARAAGIEQATLSRWHRAVLQGCCLWCRWFSSVMPVDSM